MNIGRNDLCFCGSGKKYKKCCMIKIQNPELVWKENFDKLDIVVDKKEELKTIMFDTYQFMKKNDWQGACHVLSSIQYILLNEIGLNPKLCIGVVEGFKGTAFDHSWIELDNEVYDITVANGIDVIKVSEPIIAGVNIATLKRSELVYNTNQKLDFPASMIKDMSITEYLDGFVNQPINDVPAYLKCGLWNLILDFAKNINLELNIDELREKYSKVKRTIV